MHEFPSWLERALKAAGRERLVLVIDGLDLLDERDGEPRPCLAPVRVCLCVCVCVYLHWQTGTPSSAHSCHSLGYSGQCQNVSSVATTSCTSPYPLVDR